MMYSEGYQANLGFISPGDAKDLYDLAFGGNERAGGADPCCPQGYDPAGTWPTNSNMEGAPPDYRHNGSPLTDPSASGTGRLKDDFCDCVPFLFHGRRWVLGEVRDGKVYTGTPSNKDRGVWVEVDATGRAIFVPGFGTVGDQGTGTEGGSGGGTNVGDMGLPTAPGYVGLVAVAAILGGVFLATRGGKK